MLEMCGPWAFVSVRSLIVFMSGFSCEIFKFF